MDKKVKVESLPKCDFCGQEAHYDGKTKYGSWGNMCLACFGEYGIGLGTGLGQELVKREHKTVEAIKTAIGKLPLAKMISNMEEVVYEGIMTVACPHCGEERNIEPDGDYEDVECDGCGNHYRTMGIC